MGQTHSTGWERGPDTSRPRKFWARVLCLSTAIDPAPESSQPVNDEQKQTFPPFQTQRRGSSSNSRLIAVQEVFAQQLRRSPSQPDVADGSMSDCSHNPSNLAQTATPPENFPVRFAIPLAAVQPPGRGERSPNSAPTLAATPSCGGPSTLAATPVSYDIQALKPARAAWKKAIVIGIQNVEGYPTLRTPHRDCFLIKNFLQSWYGYTDILCILDDGVHKSPSLANLEEELQKFTQGAREGDRFFVYFAGHGTQVDKPIGQRSFSTSSEADMKDEAIVAGDDDGSDTRIIIDNKLKKWLVDPLPPGASLIAVFDCCHSATILDLGHHLCNQVYVPWCSKGIRNEKTLRSPQVKRMAGYPEGMLKTLIEDGARPLAPGPFRGAALWNDPTSTPALSESPDNIWCDGRCRRKQTGGPKKDLPNVILLAASKDSQLAWDGVDDNSMTTALLDVLEANKHPTLKDLLTRVSHLVHKSMLGVHADGHARRKEQARNKEKRNVGEVRVEERDDQFETVNFQDPMLSSLEPLNMDQLFLP